MQIRGWWIRYSGLQKAVPEVPRGPDQCAATMPGFGSMTPWRDKRSRLRPTRSEWQPRIQVAAFGSTYNHSSYVTKLARNGRRPRAHRTVCRKGVQVYTGQTLARICIILGCPMQHQLEVKSCLPG